MGQDTRVIAVDPGCWVDGWYGQYATARLIDIATALGFPAADYIDVAERHLACMGQSDTPEIGTDEFDILADGADAAESWMNDHAPTGYRFGWVDGEFYMIDTSEECNDTCHGSHVVYVVGHSMPGYLPESDPWAHDSWESAKADLLNTIDRDGDHYQDISTETARGDEWATLAEECSGVMEDLNLSNGPEWSTIVGNVAYWINRDDLTCDEYAEVRTYQDAI